MNDISRQELTDIAHISGFELNDDEYAVFAEEIRSVLLYIEELASVTITQCKESNDVQSPLVREDKACNTDEKAYQRRAQQLVLNAPVHEDTYFVVPKMIRKTSN